MRFLCALLIMVCPLFATAQELVRVNISAFSGPEPITLDSTTNPALFTLDPRVASVELTTVNPAAPNKEDRGPATYQPSITPELVGDPDPAGFIQLTITPAAGESLILGQATFTTAAVFASNPSSIQLRTEVDGFTASLAVVNLDVQRTTQTVLPVAPINAPFQIRWLAGNDFGENGGGPAGFVANDLIITEGPVSAGALAVPVFNVWGMVVLLMAMLVVALIFNRRRHFDSI